MMKKILSLTIIKGILPIINDDTNDIASALNNKAGAL